MSESLHVFALGDLTPQTIRTGGSRAYANASNFPLLKGMSLYRLLLHPRGAREPHWHPNAHELTYCVRGDALVTIFSDGSLHDTFAIGAGEMFFVPSGYLHHIENTGSGDAEFIITFSHENPDDFGLSGAVGCMSNSVLGNTWGLRADAFQSLRKEPTDTVIGLRKSAAEVTLAARFPNRHKFAVDKSAAPLANSSGSVRTATKKKWPILEDLSMFSLHITDTGMREPHWHPRTAELGYLREGRARMTILSPGARVDTYDLVAGDVYFIPPAYPHHIENIDGKEARFLVFFDRGDSEDIGYSASLRANSNEVLAATFGGEPSFFQKLPDFAEDLLLVPRINPVDP